MKASSVAPFALVLLAAAALAWQVNPEKLPPPFATGSASNGPQVIPRPPGAQLKAPPGFQVEEYASGFEVPRFMLRVSHGVLLSDSSSPGTVWVLEDGAGFSRPKSRYKLLERLNRPYGLAFWKDYLYVAEATSVKRYKYDAQAMKVSGRAEEIVPMNELGQGHWTRTLLFDRAGDEFYLAIGSASNDSPGEDPRRAAVNRYNPDGSGHEIFSSGPRNPIGLHWYPNTDTLWATVQERDGLGNDLPPDYFTHLERGGFYGWPYAYIGPNPDPHNGGKRPDLVKKTIVPDVLLGAHVSALDFIFYTGKQFPAEYRGGAFIAFHGSWNRSPRVGYKIAFVPFKNAKPVSGPRDFVTGFMLSPEKREVWGRPVGLLELPDGSVLFSDDGGRKIWRISHKGRP